MTSVVILTSGELRHRFVRMCLAADDRIEVLRSYCEHPTVGLAATLSARAEVDPIERDHLSAREASEDDFFGTFCRATHDRSRPIEVPRGAINHDDVVDEIIGLAPDVVAAFGCSLVDDRLIDAFPGHIVNLHLGLSPYYRGSGTNLWPLIHGRPELVGATFMYLDAGIDTGEIIHQVRARIVAGDDAHRIGNRVIADAALAYREVLHHLDELGHRPQPPEPDRVHVHRRSDVDVAALQRLRDQLDRGLIPHHLQHRQEREAAAPIVVHPLMERSN